MNETELTYPIHLVGNVAQHDRGADIAAIENALAADTVVLISWVTLVWAVEGARGRTITNKTTLVINARLGTVG